MFFQLLKEGLTQFSSFEEQATLAVVVIYEDGGIKDVLVDQSRPTARLNRAGFAGGVLA